MKNLKWMMLAISGLMTSGVMADESQISQAEPQKDEICANNDMQPNCSMLSSDEKMFSNKLNSNNQMMFCNKFNRDQRMTAMKMKNMSPDQAVEKVARDNNLTMPRSGCPVK